MHYEGASARGIRSWNWSNRAALVYHFVRRYLERNPQLPLGLRQVDPLIRQLTLYRDLIESRTQNSEKENPS